MLDLGDGEVNELEMVLVSTVSRGRDMIYLHILRTATAVRGATKGRCRVLWACIGEVLTCQDVRQVSPRK